MTKPLSEIRDEAATPRNGSHDWVGGYKEGFDAAVKVVTELENKELSNLRSLLKDLCEEWNEDCDPDCSSYGHSHTCKSTHISEAKRARGEEIAEYRKALEFYGERSTWCSRSGRIGVSPIDFDRDEPIGGEYPYSKGKLARAALEKFKKEREDE